MNRLHNAKGNRWPGTDPESNSKMPDPDDPESNSKMPDPDDPESNSKMPDPDDPSSYGFPSFHRGGCGAVVVAPSCCCHDKAEPGEETAPHPWVRPRDYSGFVIVRMAPGVEHPCARSLWKLAKELGLTGLRAVLKLPGSSGEPGSRRERRSRKREHLISRPLLDFHPDRVLELEQIRSLEKKAAKSPFRPRHSLTLYWRLDLRRHPGLVEEVVEGLNGLAEVDLAYRELSAVDSMAANGQYLAEDQGYLEDAPLGIGASGIHLPPVTSTSFGSSSPKLVLCDLEQGWNTGHMDLPSSVLSINDNRAKQDAGAGHHGTAVLGQLVAMGLGPLGVRGAAEGLVTPILSSHWTSTGTFAGTNGHVAQAIVQALQASTPLAAGDILLLEVQRGLLPTEVDEADFDAIRLATALGVIVIEAAGNGGFDLDLYSDPDIRRSLRRGASDFQDSGAVLVGAARASLPHDRALFSNYGSRVDCFGWGETVTTCGYGDLAGTGNDLYTNRFSGTSSASPIIAGAAALLQALHEDKTTARLGPQAMRALLSDPATGTHQGPNVRGRIGVMPDLGAIVRDRLQLVPDVYLRRSVCDDGSAAGPHDEISSSPDILIWQGGSASTSFGEGSLRENLPAPGVSYVAGSQEDVYVRLHNRGLGDGEGDVQLFASPAATLITSERWTPAGSLQVSQKAVLQGDTLIVAGPVVPAPALTNPPGTLWSFLAVVNPSGEKAILPPGPPYFDWAEYLTFLRQPGVAWRNTYRVSPTSIPSFCITGTPDRARLFDFEVIQRLPAGATVTLQVPGALDAKLRQRQPWLQGQPGSIDLPQRPRTAIRGVQLAAGACAKATFTISGSSNVTAGHSLALRQLWRGEEVGRITWFFGPHA